MDRPCIEWHVSLKYLMARGRQDICYQKKEFTKMFFSCLSSAWHCQAGSPAFSFSFSGESTILLHPVRAQERLLMATAPDRDMDLLQSPPTGPPHRHQIAIAGIVANKQREFMLAFYQQTNALIVWTWHDIVLDQKGPCIHIRNFLS